MHLLETLSPDDLKTHSESFDPRLFSCRESTQVRALFCVFLLILFSDVLTMKLRETAA